MKKALVVVDMQNDFITGALANKEGEKIVGKIAKYIEDFEGDVIATMDTHGEDYGETQEGRKLPVPHCIKGTDGHRIVPEIADALLQKGLRGNGVVCTLPKPTFGSTELYKFLYGADEIEFVGVCTDICVISNAMITKAFFPEAIIKVHKDMCAGVTPESHENALKAMAACQIEIV